MVARYQLLTFVFSIFICSCANSQLNTDSVKENEHKYTNDLIDESSPYLLQHAHNPVNWMAWGEPAFKKAEEEGKLILVSIGYSSCHWCHVMEHESFENEEVAQVMNDNFVCIKVDREERPDVDQIYMNAVQLMTGSGGWPLNCFTLPDGRPVYGGTYFPKTQWVDILGKLAHSYATDKQKVIEYADNLTNGIQKSELIETKKENVQFSNDRLDEMMVNWSRNFDNLRGGPNRSPKFPLPNNYDFLMQYAHQYQDSATMNQVELTLEKMAFGGIYDQIGGGFARYSTDSDWKVPHFEKMLYDNAQLVSLYSHAYQRKKNPLYKEIVYQTLGWVEREMTTKEGAFYSALDADSEGEEGKYYVWTKDEIKAVVGDDYELIKSYYNLNQKGLWEGNYILLRNESDSSIADEFEMSVPDLRKRINQLNDKLLLKRAERIRPGLDDKSLTSWNAMMTVGYLDAYQSFGEKSFLDAALKNLSWLEKNQLQKNGALYHTFKKGKAKIDGFLEDYCFVIELYIKFYEVTFNEDYLERAKELMRYSINHFQDENSGMFFFTSDEGAQLIARKMEISDNVIPASNSVMARNLWKLGTLFDNEEYKEKSKQMLANVYDNIHTYGAGYSNWGMLVMHIVEPYFEVAIMGENWEKQLRELNTHYTPNKVLMGGTEGRLPLLQGKVSTETTIYVCVNKTCKLPVDNITEALKQMK